jgi:hypothetical protein
MTDAVQLRHVSERAVKAVPSFNETWGMLGNALKLDDLGRAARCCRRVTQVSEAEITKKRFENDVRRAIGLVVAAARA